MFPKKGIEKTKTHVLCSISFFFFENRAFYEIMWKYSVKPDRPHMTIWRTRFACRMTKAADTHSKYVIFIAFPLQKLLHERALLLLYTYNACLVANRGNCSTLSTLKFRPVSSVLFAVVHGLKLQGMCCHCHSKYRTKRREACTTQ